MYSTHIFVSYSSPMPKQVALAERCNVAYAMSLIGGKWKIVILLKLFEGTLRFAELRRQLADISEGVLTVQLKELESDGLIVRDSDGTFPSRSEYYLTPAGASLAPALRIIDGWGAAKRDTQPSTSVAAV